jgi:mannosyltransferase OCH1-like enzyme
MFHGMIFSFVVALFASVHSNSAADDLDTCTSDAFSTLQRSSHPSKHAVRSGFDTREAVRNEIPKIIHHVYKDDISAGPWPNDIWKDSFLAWKKFYPEPEYKHLFWSDSEVTKLIDTECSEFSESFHKETRAIVKSDFSRYCILWRMGGIYADLDYMPLQNFYADLKPGMVNLVQSPYQSESVQNSLMASPPSNSYWWNIMDMAHYTMRASNVLLAAGPRLLDVTPQTQNASSVHILPCNEFQRVTKSAEEQLAIKKGCKMLKEEALGDRSLKGIHWGTVSYDSLGNSAAAAVPDRWSALFQGDQKDEFFGTTPSMRREILANFVSSLLS